MVELIVAPDIESLLIDYLTTAMPQQGPQYAVPVADELAAGELTESLAVYRSGGIMLNMVVDEATIVVESKGATLVRSAELASMARALMHWLAGRELAGHGISRVQEYSGPVNLPMPDSPTRYTQTFSLDIQAEIRS